MFEQERAADAEVDALQLDKRHPPIVAATAMKAAVRGFVGRDRPRAPGAAANGFRRLY
jgi:hypothetical protein